MARKLFNGPINNILKHMPETSDDDAHLHRAPEGASARLPVAVTPRETKCLSHIDERFFPRYVPAIFLYRGSGVQAGDDRDPVAVIRRALGEALVPYYPLAGWLKVVEERKLAVNCTGEGVLFVEADADVQLAVLEAAGLKPPFLFLDKLLPDFEGSSDVVNRPFLIVQVTRLLCSGFVLAFRCSHTICDATGMVQFMSAVAELARGLPSPTITPAWSRELLQAHSSTKSQADEHDDLAIPPPLRCGDKVTRTFTFFPHEIARIKRHLPPHLRKAATSFEVLMAVLWRARTAALELPPDEEVSLLFYNNLRGVRDLGLPSGYYGNAVIITAVATPAGELLAHSLGDTVKQVQETKAAVNAEFVRSTTDPLMLHRWTDLRTPNAFRVTDIRLTLLYSLDFGWGEPVYGGRTDTPYEMSSLHAVRNGDGENAVAVPIVLPSPAMDRFAWEVEKLLTAPLPALPRASPATKARL